MVIWQDPLVYVQCSSTLILLAEVLVKNTKDHRCVLVDPAYYKIVIKAPEPSQPSRCSIGRSSKRVDDF